MTRDIWHSDMPTAEGSPRVALFSSLLSAFVISLSFACPTLNHFSKRCRWSGISDRPNLQALSLGKEVTDKCVRPQSQIAFLLV